MVVLASGMSWDDAWMTEKHLATALARRVPVLFVDPPMSLVTPLRKPHLRAGGWRSRLQVVGPRLARLTPMAPPGVSRPVLRDIAHAVTRHAIARAVRQLGGDVAALLVASLDDVMGACPARVNAVYGTDDWVAGASLMGLSTGWLEARERAQLARADVALAVSPELAERWRPMVRSVAVLPNGVDAAAYAATDEAPRPRDVELPEPIAGFIGHMSARIDLDLVEAVADTGHSVLLVGPRQLTFDPARLDALLTRQNVQWTGPRPFGELASYLRVMSVGLTPYADTPFNRASFPLKTLEYLAAGRPAVVTDLPSARALPSDLVARVSGPDAFAAATVMALEAPHDPELARRRRAYAATQSWDVRAAEVLRVLGLSPA